MKKLINTTNLFTAVFVVILLYSAFLTMYPISHYNFPFTMDQARDMLDIREIVVSLHPSLIGPTTSINGVFLGPFYYYFNVIPFLIGGGDPAALAYWNSIWYLIGASALFYFNYKKNFWFGFFSSILFLLCNEFFYSSRFFWSANPMPYMTAIYFLSLVYLTTKRDKKSGFIGGIVSGLSMQVEAAFGVIFFPFLIVYSLIRRVDFRTIAFSVIGFLLTLLPQLLFEIRHGFLMTKTFFKELSGDSQILGEKMDFTEAQSSHLSDFINYTNGIIQGQPYITHALLILAVGFLIYRFKTLSKLNKEYFLSATLFVIFALVFYSWYLHPLKGWYILGLRVPYIIILSLLFAELFRLKYLALKIGVIGILIFSTYNMNAIQWRFVPEGNISNRSGGDVNLRNEVEAVDWVYEKAAGRGFKAYNYLPSVYDYPYQYIYWWHGTQKYGYQPETVTYMDNVPEYIKENDKYFDKRKPAGDDPLVFLIYQKDESLERLHAWLGNFTKYCTVEKHEYLWRTTVEMRKLCR